MVGVRSDFGGYGMQSWPFQPDLQQLPGLSPGAPPPGLYDLLWGNQDQFNRNALSPDLQQLLQTLGMQPEQGSAAPVDARQGQGQLPFNMNPQELMALLIAWVLMSSQQQQQQGGGGRNAGSLPQANFKGGQPASWGGGGGGGAPSAGGGSGSPTASGPAPDLGNMPTGKGTAGEFLKAALAQKGDRYVYGAETNLNDANPDTFDCSELVQWAGAQAGVQIPDGSGNQEAWCRQHGTSMSVEEAIRTPGALLFKEGHVAISLGDGRTIEAMGSQYGVTIGNARGRFTSGGTIPGLSYNA